MQQVLLPTLAAQQLDTRFHHHKEHLFSGFMGVPGLQWKTSASLAKFWSGPFILKKNSPIKMNINCTDYCISWKLLYPKSFVESWSHLPVVWLRIFKKRQLIIFYLVKSNYKTPKSVKLIFVSEHYLHNGYFFKVGYFSRVKYLLFIITIIIVIVIIILLSSSSSPLLQLEVTGNI